MSEHEGIPIIAMVLEIEIKESVRNYSQMTC